MKNMNIQKYLQPIILIIIILVIAYGIYWGIKKWTDGGEVKTYQALITVYDEKNKDPIEDKKSSMKKGYVIGLYPEDHQWSKTEEISYLILKIKLNEKQAQKIIEPIEEKIDIKTLSQEEQEIIKKEKKEKTYQEQKNTVSIRKYKIDLEKIDFSDSNILLTSQPFKDQIFDWKAVGKVK